MNDGNMHCCYRIVRACSGLGWASFLSPVFIHIHPHTPQGARAEEQSPPSFSPPIFGTHAHSHTISSLDLAHVRAFRVPSQCAVTRCANHIRPKRKVSPAARLEQLAPENEALIAPILLIVVLCPRALGPSSLARSSLVSLSSGFPCSYLPFLSGGALVRVRTC